MRNFLFLFVISLTVLATSCQKDDDEILAGELIAKELQSVIKEEKIERVLNFELNRSWSNTWISASFGSYYSLIKRTFIYV